MAHNKWYDEEIQIIRDNYKEMSDEELAELIPNHSLSSIITKRKEIKCIRERGKYSFDTVIEYLSKKNYTVLSDQSEYHDAHSEIKYLCPIHGEKVTTLGHLLEGKGCRDCGWELTAQKKRIDVEVFTDMHKDYCDKHNIIYVDTYRKKITESRSKIYIKFICKEHPEKGVQEIQRYDLYKASLSPCRFCSHKNLTHEDVKEMLLQFSDNFEFLSDDYNIINDRIVCRCKRHNIITEKVIGDILKGQGCVKCGIEKLSASIMLDSEEVKKRVMTLNPNIEVVGEYKGADERFDVKCRRCETVWGVYLHTSMKCPKCDHYYIGEKMTAEYLESVNIDFIPQFKFSDCKNVRPLLFDFYLPDKNICIEYNGMQHYQPCSKFGGEKTFKKQIERDKIKREYCESNGIKLIEIPYIYDTKDKIKQYLDERL